MYTNEPDMSYTMVQREYLSVRPTHSLQSNLT